MSAALAIARLTAARVADFAALHDLTAGPACWCTAWSSTSWDAYAATTPEQRRSAGMQRATEVDDAGYLLYRANNCVGWCQAGPRDRLPLVASTFGLAPDPSVYAITCVLIHPDHRRQGLATRFVALVTEDLFARGVARIESYPAPDPSLGSEHLWTGTRQMFARAGFAPTNTHPRVRIMSRTARPAPSLPT